MCVCVCVFLCCAPGRLPVSLCCRSHTERTYLASRYLFAPSPSQDLKHSHQKAVSVLLRLLFPKPLLLPASCFGIAPPTPLNGSCSVNIPHFFHNASLATQFWDCRVTYTAMLLPGSPVSFPLRAWPRPCRLQDLSQSSLHKGVSRSAAAVGPHGSSRGRTSVREQGDPDRLQSRRLSISVKTRALVRCFAPPPCVKASRARRARA
jgi:hypothetical protein